MISHSNKINVKLRSLSTESVKFHTRTVQHDRKERYSTRRCGNHENIVVCSQLCDWNYIHNFSQKRQIPWLNRHRMVKTRRVLFLLQFHTGTGTKSNTRAVIRKQSVTNALFFPCFHHTSLAIQAQWENRIYVTPSHKSWQTGVISVFRPGEEGGGGLVSMKTNRDKARGDFGAVHREKVYQVYLRYRYW